jgi:hypothetical protein
MKLIASNMDTQSAAGKQALAANFEAAVSSVRKSMREKTISVRDGMREIRRLVSQELTDVYGLSLHDASNIAKGNGKGGTFGDTDNNLGREGGAPIARAGGGWIGAPGLVGTDTVPAMLAPGEAVLNRHQQAIIEGLLGGGFLDRLFANVTTPHYMAGGGYAGVSGDTDFLPALGRALSALSRAAGTPIYVQSGRRTVAEQLAQGPSTPGHPVAGPNGPHVRGVAADITPGYSAFARLAGRFGLGFTVMPQEPWHIQLLGAAGSAAAQGATAAAASIKRVLVGGKGSMGAVAQRAVDVVRAGANRFLNSPGLLSYGGGRAGSPRRREGRVRQVRARGPVDRGWWPVAAGEDRRGHRARRVRRQPERAQPLGRDGPLADPRAGRPGQPLQPGRQRRQRGQEVERRARLLPVGAVHDGRLQGVPRTRRFRAAVRQGRQGKAEDQDLHHRRARRPRRHPRQPRHPHRRPRRRVLARPRHEAIDRPRRDGPHRLRGPHPARGARVRAARPPVRAQRRGLPDPERRRQHDRRHGRGRRAPA